MKLSRSFGVLLVIALLLSAVLAMGAAPAMAAPPTSHPDKGPIDKTVFVHYPKEAHGSAFGRVSTSGVLSSDYKYNGIHWANPTAIKYWVNPTGSGIDSATTATAVQAAFATWDNADGPLGYAYQGTTNLQAGFPTGVADGYNVVSWANISAQYPNVIAVTIVWYYRYTRQIAEVDTLMNSGLAWSYTAPNVTHDLSTPASRNITRYTDPTKSGVSGTYDIQDIMTHEAGHWIMLGDLYNSQDSALTMYGYGATAEISKDTLGYGDELGVEAVYRP